MEKKQKLVWFAKRCALDLAVAALCYLLFGVIGSWCMFRRVTGLPCLTCGMSRAWLCALRLDFAGAFFWHPLFWTVPLIALALIFFGAHRRWVRRGLIACLFLFAVVWVVRMLLLFPHTPPMTADPGGILPRLTGALF